MVLVSRVDSERASASVARLPYNQAGAHAKPEVEVILLREVDGEVRIKLRVKPNARHARVGGAHGDALRVEVVAAPEEGKANREVERMIAAALEIAPRNVRVASGQGSRDKSVAVTGLTLDEVRARLLPLSDGA